MSIHGSVSRRLVRCTLYFVGRLPRLYRSDHHRNQPKPLTKVQRHPVQQRPRCHKQVLRVHLNVCLLLLFPDLFAAPLAVDESESISGLHVNVGCYPYQASRKSASQNQHVELGFVQ